VSDRFNRCLQFTLSREGGFVDDPSDHGGATNYGITQRVYTEGLAGKGLLTKSVRLITLDEVSNIYQEKYWLPSNAGNCPVSVDLCVFDLAVNSGVGRAVRFLQRAVGVVDDGVFGPATHAAVLAANPVDLAAKLCEMRRNFYLAIVDHDPSQSKFLKGWLSRVDALEKEIRA
jgi:lysozyme family protein